MKIEKINENKIRCILTRDDLEIRHIKLSEIAYGSEKAPSLFRDDGAGLPPVWFRGG